MKRFNFLSIFGAALLVGANVANAQDAESLSKAQLGNEFHPHWTLNLQAGAAYTLGEGSFDELLSPSAAISATYQALDWLGVLWEFPDGRRKVQLSILSRHISLIICREV